MWIEQRSNQHRAYWRTKNASGPKKDYEAFASREQAELFIKLSRMTSLVSARNFLRDPETYPLEALLGLSSPSRGQATPSPSSPASTSPYNSLALASGASTDLSGSHATDEAAKHLVGITFSQLWERFIERQLHLEEGTTDLYKAYEENHFRSFFGRHDIGLIQRTRPLRECDAVPGAVYVDDWIQEMLGKERRNNAGNPIKGRKLSIKFIKNTLTVLAQAFDVALQERPAALLQVNPAKEIRLPKQDRREMFFLEDAAAYAHLRDAMHTSFWPLLDFLVGTGARFGEAAGLLVLNVHLDVERPYVEIRVVLKWAGKRWKLGRPKTKSSVRRISVSPKLAETLRPLVAGKDDDAHVFTMVEGGPLHHGNFTNRYFKPAVKTAGGKVPKRLRIHDLRHTHAAWLLSDGVPVFTVQRRLGHSSSSTTQDVYGHLTPEADDRALALLDRRLPEIFNSDGDDPTVLRLTQMERELPVFDVDDEDDLAA